jgi:uncharacterized UBP type Zn finger protein
MIDSPKVEQQNEFKRRTLIKGLFNIGNTCFFNVIIQVCIDGTIVFIFFVFLKSLAHTTLLIDTMYRTICILMEENGRKYSSTTTAQLMNIFDEFTSADRKKPSIDPKPLFNSLIQK